MAEIAASPLRKLSKPGLLVGFGLETMLQLVPSQCSIAGFPVRHVIEEYTLRSPQPRHWLGRAAVIDVASTRGIVTATLRLQLVPLKCKTGGPPVPASPTAQTSLLASGRTTREAAPHPR